eukprot:scaffold87028_cov61-Phaeocystis_antarctica.AAC.1
MPSPVGPARRQVKGSFECASLISAAIWLARRNSAARLPSGVNEYSPVGPRERKSRLQRNGGRLGGGGEGDSVAVAASGAASRRVTTIKAADRKMVAVAVSASWAAKRFSRWAACPADVTLVATFTRKASPTTVRTGVVSTVGPSTPVAALAVAKAAWSLERISSWSAPSGTVMLAVIITLPSVTTTAVHASHPRTLSIFLCVSPWSKLANVVLAMISTCS